MRSRPPSEKQQRLSYIRSSDGEGIGVNGALFIQRRSRRHMARLLEQYEALVAPHLPKEALEKSETFKSMARDTLKEFAGDSCDALAAAEEGLELNGYATELRDRLSEPRHLTGATP